MVLMFCQSLSKETPSRYSLLGFLFMDMRGILKEIATREKVELS